MKEVFPQTKTLFFMSGALFLMTVTLYSLGMVMTTKAGEDIQALQGEISSALVKKTSLKSLEDDFRSTENEQAILDEYVLPKDGGVSQFEELDSLASLAGVSLQNSSVTTEDIPNNKDVRFVKIVGSASGSFSSTRHFLRLLEEFPKASIVEDIEFSQNGTSEKKIPEWRLSFILKTLVKK